MNWRPLSALAGVGALAAAFSLLTLGSGGPAEASTALVACTNATANVSFSPGISTTSGTVALAATANASGCSSAQFPTIVSATLSISSASGTASCTPPNPLGTGAGGSGSWSGTATVTWLDATNTVVGTSTLSFTVSYSISTTGTITVTDSATVTAGLFNGGTGVAVISGVVANLPACALPQGLHSAVVNASASTIVSV